MSNFYLFAFWIKCGRISIYELFFFFWYLYTGKIHPLYFFWWLLHSKIERKSKIWSFHCSGIRSKSSNALPLLSKRRSSLTSKRFILTSCVCTDSQKKKMSIILSIFYSLKKNILWADSKKNKKQKNYNFTGFCSLKYHWLVNNNFGNYK